MYNVFSSVLVSVGILAGILFLLLAPLMAVYIFDGIRQELDLRKGRRLKKALKAETGKHRLLDPVELAKRELREQKAKAAREDAFFDGWWRSGDTSGLEVHPLDDPRYNLATLDYHALHVEMDVANENNIMKVANEGL